LLLENSALGERAGLYSGKEEKPPFNQKVVGYVARGSYSQLIEEFQLNVPREYQHLSCEG